jgi:DNA polymerase-3 subunit alpha
MNVIPAIVTPYSFRGSVIRIEKLPEFLKSFGYRSAIIADPNFHAHVLFNEVLRKNGLIPVHAIVVGRKIIIAKDREGYENIVRFKSRGEKRLKNVVVMDFSLFRPVMYIEKRDRKLYEIMRRILGLEIGESDYSFEKGGEDPLTLYDFKPYDLKVTQVFPSPPDDWIDFEKLPREWIERLEKELNLVRKKRFEGYFRAVQLIVDTAKKLGIRIGPGRGSAVGSLLSYVLGITSVNPLEYGLIFERFINEGRTELPDIDIDVEDEKRRKLIENLRNVFEFVSLVSTFSTLREQSLRRISKELSIKISSRIAEKLYGLPIRRSVHAAGVIVSAEDMNLPFYTDGNLRVCEYDMESLKLIGAEKIDILGLRTLTFLSKLSEKTGVETPEIPTDDLESYETIARGMTTGVFQLESREARVIAKYVAPKNITELSHVLALNRPGPLRSKLHEEYLKRRVEKKWSVRKELSDILDETLGLAIYQEQIMMMAVRLAGMSLSEADDLRKAISKKDPEKMRGSLRRLRSGMEKRGYDRAFIDEMIDFIKEFASYAFNKSHSVAYSHLSYYISYYKTHFFPQFFLSFIEHSPGDREKIDLLIKEAVFLGYKVEKPSVRKPSGGVEEKTIVLPLKIIRGVSGEIVEKLEEAEVRSVTDFLRAVGSKSIAESLVKAGAFDEFYESRKEALIALKVGDSHRIFQKLKTKFGEVEEELKPESLEDRILLERDSMGFAVSLPDFESKRPKISEAYAVWERRVAHVISLGNGILSDGKTVIFKEGLPKGKLAVVIDPDKGVDEWAEWKDDLKIECIWEPKSVRISCMEYFKR